MKSPFNLLIFFFLYITATGEDGINISVIPKEHVILGCGCSFQEFDKENTLSNCLFSSDVFDTAIMYVDGKIKKIVSKKEEGMFVKIYGANLGDSIVIEYKAPDFSFSIYANITFVCPPNSEGGCEITKFDGQLVVKNKKKIKIKGDCGC